MKRVMESVILKESRLSLVKAAKYAKRCCSTIKNWIRLGIRVESGRRVHLDSVRYGGQRITSKEAIDRFLDEINEEG